ncbi:PAS domain-containing sensor histidine kinase [Fundidesulfovibrio putealis]|uniref:PAS domain-containing sensor histidine kinase n=1 Tax=Fundidesulfovibrio putealis TaxID=270496 RepID=UPI00040E03A9|nr:PAS domain S-box protein [Fundidesulfovibrio putealis]
MSDRDKTREQLADGQEAPVPPLEGLAARRTAAADFTTLFNLSQDMVAVADIETATFVLVNPSFSRVLGYSEQELTGRPFLEFVHPDDLGRTLAVMDEKIRQGQQILHFENRYRCKGGGVRWLSWVSSTVPEEGLVYAIARDVTEQKESQERLRQSEEKFRTIFDSINECIFVHDARNGAILEVNQRVCEVYGYSREEILRLDVGSLSSGVEPYDREHAFARIREAFKGIPQHFEWQARRKDGGLFWADVSLRVARLDNADRVLVTVRDVSDRKQAQDEILREKAFTEALMNSVPGLIYMYDEQGRLVRWNKKHEELTGYTSEELARMTLMDWYKDDPEEIAKIQAAVARIPVEGFSTSEGNLRNKDGSRRLYYFTGVPLVLEGKQYFTGIGIDFTEMKRMRELMVQTEKMLSVGGLAAGMAHEINNPLSGILQNVQVVMRRLTEDLDGNRKAAAESGCSLESVQRFMEKREVLASLECVREAGCRAGRIVSSMLEFARKNEGRTTEADIAALLDRAVELAGQDYDLRKNYDFRQIRIEREYDPSLPPVECAANEIEQVVLNLLRNAAQAACGWHGNGLKPVIRLKTSREGGMARIEVVDNGPGMEEDVRKRVFEPFFTTKPVGVGTGLGLSVSYFIITSNHRGVIEVESSPGKGSRFIICLPLKQSACGDGGPA